VAPIAQLSIYICYSFEAIRSRVRINCVAQYVAPFSNISLAEIASPLGTDKQEATENLMSAIHLRSAKRYPDVAWKMIVVVIPKLTVFQMRLIVTEYA
jgi:hypothetical protein